MERAVISWSGGKDSALALHEVSENSRFEVAELLTMVSGEHDRTSFHGVRTDLLERQADALGIPLRTVPLSADMDGDDYVELLTDVMESYADRGVDRFVLGDVHRDDPDTYREEALDEVGFKRFYPLLDEDTAELAERFVELGFEARTVCVKAEALDREFLGRTVDDDFLDDLPDDVDPGGEDGEYHTFVTGGPPFKSRVEVEVGETTERSPGNETHYYCDLKAP